MRQHSTSTPGPNNHNNGDQRGRNNTASGGAAPVEPMTLAKQIAHLRQLAIADPNTTLLDLTIINALDELAEAVQELSERVASAEIGRL